MFMKKFFLIMIIVFFINCNEGYNSIPEQDFTRPYVVKKEISREKIVINFNEPIKERSINSQNIKLKDSENKTISAEINYDADTNSIIFKPDENLDYGITYQMYVSQQIQDLKDNTMQSDYFFYFSEPAPDLTEPYLIEPFELTTKQCIIRTSEVLKLDSLHNNIKLFRDDQEIELNISFNNIFYYITLKPKYNDLEFDTEYRIVINNKIEDLNSNILELKNKLNEIEYIVKTPKAPDSIKPSLVEEPFLEPEKLVLKFSEHLDSTRFDNNTVLISYLNTIYPGKTLYCH